MAQIKVRSGGAFVNPKGVHVYNSSSQLWLRDKVGYVRVNGTWIPFIQYFTDLYNRGVVNSAVNFTELATYAGLNRGSVTITNNANNVNIVMTLDRDDTTWCYYGVTPYDITNYTKLKMECYYVASGSSAFFRLALAAGRNDVPYGSGMSESVRTELNYLNGTYGTETEPLVVEVNLSSLSGSYNTFLRITASPAINGGNINFTILRMWLE